MEEPKKKGNGFSIFLLILLLLVLGGGAYLYFSGTVELASNKPKCNEEKTSQVVQASENETCTPDEYTQEKNITDEELLDLYSNMVSRFKFYALVDINGDDIVELIVTNEDSEATKEYRVYTYDEKNTSVSKTQKLTYAGSFENTDGMVYIIEDENLLLSFSGIQCVETLNYYKMYSDNLIRVPSLGGTKELDEDGINCEYSKAPSNAVEIKFTPSSDLSALK